MSAEPRQSAAARSCAPSPAEQDDAPAESELARRLAYYRRQLDEVAGENLRKDYEISGLRKEILQRVRAFALLSDLQERIGVQRDIGDILRTVMTSITASLGMDRTVIFKPTETENEFRPWFWTGFTEEGRAEEFERHLREFSISLPELTTRNAALLVNRQTESTPLIEKMKAGLETPFFVCLPIIVEERPIALILSGRVKETATVFAAISDSDVETFRAIAGLVSAVVQNMRVAVLEETNRLKTDFFANISHEFRTPITLSLGPISNMLQDRYGELPAGAAEKLKVVEANQMRLLRLVNQLLDIAKAESGAMDVRFARVPSLNAFVASRVAHFRGLADKRRIALSTRLDPSVEEVAAYIDPEKFDRALLNLLSNAHKFTPAGGTITVATRRDAEHTVVSVADSGIGISPDQLPHIFDRFRQADGSRSREFVGTGIGLALVKEFIELHGGRVHATSAVGKGSTFHLHLPVGRDHLEDHQVVEWSDEDAETLALKDSAIDSREGAQDSIDVEVAGVNAEATGAHDDDKATVLVVDDNRDLRAYVRDLLVDSYNVYLGSHGLEGLEVARRIEPDLILSDFMMPKMNGAEFCQAIRDDPTLAPTPFVLLTAKAGMEDRVVGLEEGADDYLSKPFVERELKARLRNLIRMRGQELRLSREVNAAKEIQRILLPQWPQHIAPFRFDAVYAPCVELSGDFFDVIRGGGDDLWLYVADVTSHGAAAAQVTLLLKGMVREVLEHHGPANVCAFLEQLQNDYARLALDYDVGIQAIRLNLVDRCVEYAAGNAPVAISVQRDGTIAPLVADCGPGLTARPGAQEHRYKSTSIRLAPGESLHLYTDGCIEFLSRGRRFGTRRLSRLLQAVANEASWSQAVRAALEARLDGAAFEDDLTVIRVSCEA